MLNSVCALFFPPCLFAQVGESTCIDPQCSSVAEALSRTPSDLSQYDPYVLLFVLCCFLSAAVLHFYDERAARGPRRTSTSVEDLQPCMRCQWERAWTEWVMNYGDEPGSPFHGEPPPHKRGCEKATIR
jgi:hypothetical protein